MDEEKQQQVEEKVNPFLELPKIYVNAVKLTRTYYDFQLVFGHSVIDNITEEENSTYLRPQFIAQMSPQHFKVFVQILNKQLAKYEDEFGKIPDPPKRPESDEPKQKDG